MVRYRIHPQVIDIIARVYAEDETVISMLDREERVRVSSGIRQGCTASTVLFKLIAFEMIKGIRERGERFALEGLDLTSSFFADDSVLFANSLEMAERNVGVLREVGEYYGLKINMEKSKALVYRCSEKLGEVGGGHRGSK